MKIKLSKLLPKWMEPVCEWLVVQGVFECQCALWFAPLSAHSRLPELPPDMISISKPNVVSSESASADSV